MLARMDAEGKLRFHDDADRDDPTVQSFVARIPEVQGLHAARGLTEAESWATLQELPRHAHLDRLLHGTPGLRKDWWVELAYSGRLFELGRLQFEPRDAWLNVHVAEEGGPLAPAAVDASFARAREVFPEHREARIESWLLDPQLAQLLPPDSNIVRFQRRWEIVGDGDVEDARILELVFHTLDPDLDRLPRETSLQRALVDHLGSGGHFFGPLGRLEL
jgi:hypothetical protein